MRIPLYSYIICNSYIIAHSDVGTMDTILAKNQFECEAFQFGISIKHYHTNNGIFTESQFCNASWKPIRPTTSWGLVPTTQNGPAKCAIKQNHPGHDMLGFDAPLVHSLAQ